MSETKRLTNADLAEIKKRAEAASDGDWSTRYTFNAFFTQYEVVAEGIVAKVAVKEDATFIAHARQDVPALLAEVEALNKKLDSLAKDASEETIENIRYRLALERIVNGDVDSLGDAYRIASEALRDA